MDLKISNLTKEFDGFKAVSDFSHQMHCGVYGLLGVNGAGKTTLMRMLTTLITPTSGRITWDGEDIFAMDGKYRMLLGYLPQDFGFYPDFSVYDYLMYIAALKGIRPAAAKQRVNELLRQVGLTKARKKKMKTLSGGMKRRAGIAQVRTELKELFGIDAAIADCQALSAEGCAALLQDLLCAFPLGEVRVWLPRWVEALDADSPIRCNIFSALLERCSSIRSMGQAEGCLSRLEELEEVAQVTLEPAELSTGTVRCRIRLPESLYYSTLSRKTGASIRSDGDLMRLLAELTDVKAEYDRVAQALSDARTTGYGVVLPSREEMTLHRPEMTKKGSSFGVTLRAAAPSIHMIRVDADARISPMVGSEDQSRDLMQMLSGEPDAVWDSSLFGRTVYDMVREDLGSKLLLAAPEVREKFRQSLSKIINEGAQGLICIIL